jgi:hypothetical protein
MVYVVAGILMVIAALFALYPIVSKRRYLYDIENEFSGGDVRRLNYLNAKKDLVLDNLKELEFEHDMDKLSEEDYARLRNDYMEEAESVVREIDQLKVREEIERLIENDVRDRRRTE